MKFVGADLHKKTIVLCVLVRVGDQRKVLQRKRFACSDTAAIRAFFEQLGEFEVVVEATASYEWFLLLIEDLAARTVLAHPKKLRVIAESTKKSDKIDAFVLAEFLSIGMIPEAWRPGPRTRQHRVLVRLRRYLRRQSTALKCKLRQKLAHYYADIAALFTAAGQEHLANLAMADADRFETTLLSEQLRLVEEQLTQTDAQLAKFARRSPQREREARAVLKTIPQVGPVTTDVVLSELGDWRRFRSNKDVVAYAGLAPGFRQSDKKRLDLHITKEGSGLLRWALVEAAWRLVVHSPRWYREFTRLKENTGSQKKAVVGVARKLLTVMFAMLRDGKGYREPG
jgi:transposase